jgi:hypothetical protein
MTVDELIEIEQIKQLRILYSHHFDGGRIDELADLFTEDAVCEFTEDFGGDWVGRDAIRANYARFSVPGQPFSFMHANTNPWIRLLGPTEANGRWYLLDLNTRPGAETPLSLFGVYDDVYRKVNGQWRIARTRIDFLWPNRSFFGYRTPGVNG